MISIRISNADLFARAKSFSEFRDRCKLYLTTVGMNYDKFTLVGHYSYIGYISEDVIRTYIKSRLPNQGFCVKSWEECCDMKTIYTAVNNNDYSKADIVKKYFYDAWDIMIKTPKREIHIDVKTALTKLEPNDNWNFLYPIVQAHKDGKDYTILAYCIYKEPNKYIIKIVNVIGYLDNDKIKDCDIIRKGERTRHNTISQTDNYDTLLGRDYNELDQLITKIIDEEL